MARFRITLRAAAVLAGLALAAQARAQDAAPDAPLHPLCTDRPTKATAACTVDAGHFQLESDLFNATLQRSAGVTTDTELFTDPTLKYGVTDSLDVELNIAPYEAVRTRQDAAPASTLYGVGDLYGRVKLNLVGDGSGAFSAALAPYVKAPTARMGIGNGAWEGGVIAPLVFNLNSALSLTFSPELDVLKDADGEGRHLAMVQVVSLGWMLPRNVSVFGELWSDADFDPHHGATQYSADLAASWGLPHDLQLDSGVNFGLNHVTPDVQAYLGVSHRF